MKLHRYIDHDSLMIPIEFQVTRCLLCLAFCGLSLLMIEANSSASRLKGRPRPVPALDAAG
ncbi:hypothetical protein DPMN_168521, partial [Dreissena polymorpha]